VMNVRVCKKGLRGVGVGVLVRVDAGEGKCALALCTDGSLRSALMTMSSGYGRWPIGDLPRGGRSGDSAFKLGIAGAGAGTGTGTGATYWPCALGVGADAVMYACCRSSVAGSHVT
jgi:hypothetical protein